jgi:hypothetical protein
LESGWERGGLWRWLRFGFNGHGWGGHAEVAEEILGVFFRSLFGEVGVVGKGDAGEEFVADGFKVHFRERGFEVDPLDFLEEGGAGGFFGFGNAEEAGVGPAAQEAAGIVEEWRGLAGRVAAFVLKRADDDVFWNAEGGALAGLPKDGAELGEDANGDSLEVVWEIGLGIFGAEFLDGEDAATGEDVAEIDAAGWDGGAGGCAGDGAVVSRGKAVEDGEEVQWSGAVAFLDEVVVEIIHAAGVGTDKNAISGEVGADIGLVDAV